jgi:DNA-binding NarL/FixJ family response regulator
MLSSAETTTVLLADAQVATRVGIRRALESHGLTIVAEAANAAEALEAALAHRPDVCVMSVRLPGGGIAATQQITDRLPETRVVMLTESEHDEDLFDALRAGALGFLPKSIPAARLPYAILGVARGEAALPRTTTARVLREFRDSGRRRRIQLQPGEKGIQLTPRELEVLQLLRARGSTSEIAARLQISDVTVRRHISALLQKLQVPDRQGAIDLLDRIEMGQSGD